MHDPNPQLKAAKTIEIQGHLIDSLTLSKVIDRIQQAGADYLVHDVQIGARKQDISSATLTIYARDEASLTGLIEDLKPYGTKLLTHEQLMLAICPSDGQTPEDTFVMQAPTQIQLGGNTIEITGAEGGLVIVVNSIHKTATIKPVNHLKAGDAVVMLGSQGLSWL